MASAIVRQLDSTINYIATHCVYPRHEVCMYSSMSLSILPGLAVDMKISSHASHLGMINKCQTVI